MYKGMYTDPDCWICFWRYNCVGELIKGLRCNNDCDSCIYNYCYKCLNKSLLLVVNDECTSV